MLNSFEQVISRKPKLSKYTFGTDACYLNAIAEIYKQFPEISLDIIGDGPEKTNLENLVTAKSIHNIASFLGTVSHSEMAKFYSRSQFYITASPTDGLSISLLEAFATGAYPILPDNPSNRSLSDLGFSVNLYNSDSNINLVKAIIDLLKKEDGLEEKCNNNRVLVEKHFDREKNMSNIESLYLNLISEVKK